jgi:Flp pilus assembly pilin Flp
MVLAALIAVACIGALQLVGTNLSSVVNKVATSIPNETSH